MDRNQDLVERATAAFRERLCEALGKMRGARSPMAFCESERLVRGLAHELAADLTQRVLQEVSDDKARAEAALAWVRSRAAAGNIYVRSEGRRSTPIRTVGGQQIEVVTPYAIGRPRGPGMRTTRGPQGTGVYPVLDQLGISGRATPALRLLVGCAVCEANSVSSARALLAGGGVELDHKAALRLTYLVSEDALRARSLAMAATVEGDDSGPFAGRRVVAAIDGGRLQVRRRVAGRPKKGGRKHFITEWREPKIITLYVQGEDGRRDRAMASVIDGTLGDADAVFELLLFHLRRTGAHAAAELTLIGDGAKWIWKRAAWLRDKLGIPADRFHEIVDYFHALERLGTFSKTQAWEEDYRLLWMAAQRTRLKSGAIEEIESVITQIAKRDPELLEKQLPYWTRNRERLRIRSFRDRGLPVGSGAVESSVRRVVNLRLKGASVYWLEEHAEGILHLRAHAKSGRWKELEANVLGITGWRPTARLRRLRDVA